MIHMRPYNDFELNNIQFLVNKQINFTTIQITETGLKKSILDATAPVRSYFLESNLHDYSQQKLGTDNKVFIPTHILTDCSIFTTQTSLYRPETKKGDPRLWVYGLTSYVKSDDIFAIIIYEKTFYVININQINIKKAYESQIISPLKDFIETLTKEKMSIAQELLALIKKNFTNWNKAEILADTGIGRTIESMSGISMNSSPKPDYKGIELKSSRMSSNVRPNLFSQVPDWSISKFKNAKQIVEKYGYTKGIYPKKTYQNTLSAIKSNSQNLGLYVDNENDHLEIIEMEDNSINKKDDIAMYLLSYLHKRLLEKHHETFWIGVENKYENGNEYFRVGKIDHTKNPILGQFDNLLEQGIITLDLALERPGHQEKGKSNGDSFLFKITKKGRTLLFPETEVYVINQ